MHRDLEFGKKVDCPIAQSQATESTGKAKTRRNYVNFRHYRDFHTNKRKCKGKVK